MPLSRREAMRLLALAATATGIDAAPRTVMLTREIGSTGERLPVIGLGTWQTFDVRDSRPLEPLLAEFVRLGGRVVDSSPMYGASEEVLGDVAVATKLRKSLFVATKVWTSGRAAGVAQMEASIRKLRGPVDLMQIHNLVDADTHLDTLRAWKREKRIRYLGITHYHAGAHDALARHIERGGIDFVQVNYSVAEREAERRLLPVAAERGVAVLINRPFAEGALFRAVRGKALPSFAKALGCTSWAQLFLKFIVSHPAVTCAIPATSKLDHLRDNIAAGSGPMPDAMIRERIAREAR